MMQEIIVAIIVVAASWSVVARYAPKALRQTCRTWAAQTAKYFGWRKLEQKLVSPAAAAASCGDGCGACNGCEPAATKPELHTAITPDALRQTIRHS